MGAALLEHEGLAAREEMRAAAPESAEEISLHRKVEALREMASALLSEIERIEASLSEQCAAPADLHTEVQRFETEIIRSALKKTGGHQRRAARLLGVKVSTLNAKLKRYGIRPEEFGGLYLVGDQTRV